MDGVRHLTQRGGGRGDREAETNVERTRHENDVRTYGSIVFRASPFRRTADKPVDGNYKSHRRSEIWSTTVPVACLADPPQNENRTWAALEGQVGAGGISVRGRQ